MNSGIAARVAACVLALSAAPAWALKPGDAVDAALLARLRIDPAKVTVIDFFAEWCSSCRKELPLISALHGRSDAAKVDFVGIDTDDTLSVAEAFQKEMRAKGALSFRVVNDPKQEVVAAFQPKGYPALYLLKGGKVVKAHMGAMPDMDRRLQQDLAEQGVK